MKVSDFATTARRSSCAAEYRQGVDGGGGGSGSGLSTVATVMPVVSGRTPIDESDVVHSSSTQQWCTVYS